MKICLVVPLGVHEKRVFKKVASLPFDGWRVAALPEDWHRLKVAFYRTHANAQSANIPIMISSIPEDGNVGDDHLINHTKLMCSKIFADTLPNDFGTEVGIEKVCKYSWEQYLRYYRIAASIARKAGRKITAPGLYIRTEEQLRWFKSFIEKDTNKSNRPDILSLHPYGKSANNDYDHRINVLDEASKLARKFDLPLWVTEVGFNIEKLWYDWLNPNWRETAKKRQIENTRRLLDHCRKIGVECVFIYAAQSDPRFNHFYGLWDENWNPTHLYYFFKDYLAKRR